jgi:hypothetical protein
VRVETRPLESLPSLSWQEQLPPLQVPLTEIVPARRGTGLIADEEFSQQQQQQQSQGPYGPRRRASS